ncbi:n-glycosylase/DNA lyase-like protein [Dichotomocladium elegans]|nr:n-glycosylase/DNA lyase-like protein [Dichotomocladium elegans]
MTLKHITSSKLLWKDLGTSPKELHLDTLKCGQSFRWLNTNDQWSCVLKGKLCILRQTPSTVLYGIVEGEEEAEMKSLLRDYFQLDRVSLEASYKRWSARDKNFEKKSVHFQGIRMLRQDPWENLVSFICSSNNNISRISQMVQKLCSRYGAPIASLDGTIHHDFPPVNVLAQDGVEQTLRELGFGYRAKYIAQTAVQVLDHEENWLIGLRQVSYSEAKNALMTLAGVGPKVADCVCLMSLDHAETIPVDTHVWQIALRDYGFAKKGGKTLTAKMYDEVADHFRGIFGEYSGWAHSVMRTS